MSTKSPKSFLEAGFSPSPNYGCVFICVLLAAGLLTDLLFAVITQQDLNPGSATIVAIVIVFLLLVAGYQWQRRITKIPFEINESAKLQRSRAVIAVPSNAGTIAKIIRYHSDKLEHIWLVNDASLDNVREVSKNENKDSNVEFHDISTGEGRTYLSTYEGYEAAVKEALELDIPKDEIVIDITGGKKPMSISAYFVALAYSLKAGYLESNYGNRDGEVSRIEDEVFQVIEYSPISTVIDVTYKRDPNSSS